MSRTDALGFLTTAVSLLAMNAVLTVAIGCSFHLIRYVYFRVTQQPAPEDSLTKIAMGSVR